MLWKELSLHPFTDPARSSLFVRREVPQGQKCYVLDTALFLASGTLLDACLAFSKFLINKLRNGEPILGFVELSLLVDSLLSILQKACQKEEKRGKEEPCEMTRVLDPVVPERHHTLLLSF